MCVWMCVDLNNWLPTPFSETQKVRRRGRILGDSRIDWILSEFSSFLARPTCSFCPHFSHPSPTEEWRQSSTQLTDVLWFNAFTFSENWSEVPNTNGRIYIYAFFNKNYKLYISYVKNSEAILTLINIGHLLINVVQLTSLSVTRMVFHQTTCVVNNEVERMWYEAIVQVLSLLQSKTTNKCTRLLISIRYIFNPYICFGK
jgi:hypothetical protein